MVSVAGHPAQRRRHGGLLVGGVLLVVVFLRGRPARRASGAAAQAFRPGPLKWIYLTLGLLMAATMADMYVPLFGQRLGSPRARRRRLPRRGTVGRLDVQRDRQRLGEQNPRDRADRGGRPAGDGGRTGAGGASAQFDDASPWVVAVWALALVITGCGVGMAWPHLSAWAMGCVDDPAEGGTAAAAINTVQLICGAFGAGLGRRRREHDRPGRRDRGAVDVRRVRRAGGVGVHGVLPIRTRAGVTVSGLRSRRSESCAGPLSNGTVVLSAGVAERIGTGLQSR